MLIQTILGSITKNVGSQHAGEVWYDMTGDVKETVTIDSNGYATFSVKGRQNGKCYSVWVRDNSKNYDIYISEYKKNVPSDFEIVWEMESKKDIRNFKNEKRIIRVGN